MAICGGSLGCARSLSLSPPCPLSRSRSLDPSLAFSLWPQFSLLVSGRFSDFCHFPCTSRKRERERRRKNRLIPVKRLRGQFLNLNVCLSNCNSVFQGEHLSRSPISPLQTRILSVGKRECVRQELFAVCVRLKPGSACSLCVLVYIYTEFLKWFFGTHHLAGTA